MVRTTREHEYSEKGIQKSEEESEKQDEALVFSSFVVECLIFDVMISDDIISYKK